MTFILVFCSSSDNAEYNICSILWTMHASDLSELHSAIFAGVTSTYEQNVKYE